MQREAVALTFMTVLLAIARIGLRLATGNEGRQAVHIARIRGRGILLTVVVSRLLFALRLLLFARLIRLRLALGIILLMLARGMRLAAAGMRLHAFFAVLEVFVVALFAALRALLEWLALAELLLRRRDQAEIMFGVLVIIFRRDRITRSGRIARQLDIFIGDMVGRSADFHLRAVGFVNPGQRIMILAAAATAATTTSTHSVVLILMLVLMSVSHSSPVRDSSSCGLCRLLVHFRQHTNITGGCLLPEQIGALSPSDLTHKGNAAVSGLFSVTGFELGRL
jgi:hypothetical protein